MAPKGILGTPPGNMVFALGLFRIYVPDYHVGQTYNVRPLLGCEAPAELGEDVLVVGEYHLWMPDDFSVQVIFLYLRSTALGTQRMKPLLSSRPSSLVIAGCVTRSMRSRSFW